jgi:hypothetical protein
MKQENRKGGDDVGTRQVYGKIGFIGVVGGH